jgi:hypothetical protein
VESPRRHLVNVFTVTSQRLQQLAGLLAKAIRNAMNWWPG